MSHSRSERTWSREVCIDIPETGSNPATPFICTPQIPNEIPASSAMESCEILYEALFSFEDHPKNPLH
jgi:hypothetical protein